MRAWLLLLLSFSFCGVAMAGDTYCEQLKEEGLEGKKLAIIPDHEGERNFMQGTLIRVQPGTLVVQLSGSRAYVNCAHIHSIVVGESGPEKAIPKQ